MQSHATICSNIAWFCLLLLASASLLLAFACFCLLLLASACFCLLVLALCLRLLLDFCFLLFTFVFYFCCKRSHFFQSLGPGRFETSPAQGPGKKMRWLPLREDQGGEGFWSHFFQALAPWRFQGFKPPRPKGLEKQCVSFP